jgi:hypothetical protein
MTRKAPRHARLTAYGPAEDNTMYVDFSSRYHRRMLHYESDGPLSLPELIAQGSVDARTGGLLWTLLERRASYIISGPTAAEAGAGKTTTLNALLPFYPSGTALVFTLGMFEDFSFLSETTPEKTTVLANEVSDHLNIYMWGRNARRFLRLPEEGFAIATSCHADTLSDVVAMLSDDIRLTTPEIQQMRIIINIGLDIPMRVAWRTGRDPKRRWLTVHFLPPAEPGTAADAPVKAHTVSRWDRTSDTFSGPSPEGISAMAAWAGLSPDEFSSEVERRASCLQELADRQANDITTLLAIESLRQDDAEE